MVADQEPDRGGVALLEGIRVVELAAIGPVPFAVAMLADLGADVVQLRRRGAEFDAAALSTRNRRIVEVDLKGPDLGVAQRLIDRADVLVEGFRPGVLERLGLEPTDCMSRNPRLIIARMSGWGQTGAGSETAGHDINYIARAGLLHWFGGPQEKPKPPVNIAGDLAGAGTQLLSGVLAALVHRERRGGGVVVDASIVDAAVGLTARICDLTGSGEWNASPGTNSFDGGSPFYGVYETKDGRYVAVGALEDRFYEALVSVVGTPQDPRWSRDDPDGWPELRERLSVWFLDRSLSEISALFEDGDACVAPVLTIEEAAADPIIASRGRFKRLEGRLVPRTTPRFSGASDWNPVGGDLIPLNQASTIWPG